MKKLTKINREPFYNELFEDSKSFEQIEEAGFFLDSNDSDIDWDLHTNLLCTPINFLKVHNDKPKCILISTGAFSPLHQGHIDMMEAAKSEVEDMYDVLGGYLSPGHDEYIKYKTGDKWIPIQHRLDYANTLIKDREWLSMDPWEGVFAPGAVNFTSVVYRLSLYLDKHLLIKDDITIFFVCGEDNARFSLTFDKYQDSCKFGTIIVTRPGYAKTEDRFKLNNTHIAVCNSTLSSTQLRNAGFKIKEKPKQAYLRMSWNNVEKQIKTILSKYIDIVWVKEIKEQLTDYRLLNNQIDKDKIINLDIESQTQFKYNLNISRLYDFYGQKQIGYTNRPGTESIENQLENIPNNKDYYLFDDDIHSGKTMNFVSDKLKEKNIISLGRLSYISSNETVEICDSLDFLFGSEYGLVVKYNGDNIRVPYLYPFVCPTTRCSINDPLQFSIDMWELNMNIWKDKNKTISDINFKYLYKLGFNKDTTIYNVCKFYYEFLLTLKKY